MAVSSGLISARRRSTQSGCSSRLALDRFKKLVEKDYFFLGKSPEAFGVPDDDPSHRQFGQDLQDLIDLFLIFDKQDLRLRMAHHIGDLFRSRSGIDPARDPADTHMPRSQKGHSGRFSPKMETLSPGRTPREIKPAATMRTISPYSFQEICFQMPKSLWRSATRS